MKKWKEKFSRFIASFLSLLLVIQFSSMAVPVTPVYAATTDKMIICHSGSGSNYNDVEISPSAAIDKGHTGHDYDVYPPFYDGDMLYPGKNWDATGQSLWEDSCGIAKPVAYDVFYNGNGQTSGIAPDDTSTYSSGETVTVLGNTGGLVKTGYVFSGWNTKADGLGTTYLGGETFNIASNTILYARWTVGNYTVSFESNGGTPEPIDQVVAYGGPVSPPTAPTKTGHGFIGWYEDSGLTNSWDFSTETVSGNMTLYAKWSLNSYAVTVTAIPTEGGFVSGGGEYKHGDFVSLIASVNTGYHFANWSGYCSGTSSTFAFNVVGSVTCVANFTIDSYTISFDSNGGTAVTPITQNYGTTVSEPTDPTREGYSFDGWSPSVPSTMPAYNQTLKAEWEINSYTINFNSAGGTEVDPITRNYGAAVTAPIPPTRLGYTFAGWTPVVPSTMPAFNQTLVAGWTICAYTITFDSDGGTPVADITQDYGSAITAPANPTKTGYTFAGWDLPVPPTMPEGGASLTALWVVNEYTITFDSNGGSAVGPITQDFGTAITAPTDPIREGYTFDGWSPVVPASMPAEDMILYANWSINSYTVTVTASPTEGGTVSGNGVYNYGADVTLTAVADIGWHFTTWSGDCAGPISPYTINDIASDKSCIANFDVNEYEAKFDIDGDITTVPTNFGEAITAPADPTKEGYTFDGWSPEVPTSMPAGDMTFVAQWVVNEYTITFNSNGGSTVAPITQDFGTAITAPTDPIREGYTFNGWSPVVPASMSAEDMILVAQWSAVAISPLISPVVSTVVTPETTPVAVSTDPIVEEEIPEVAGEEISTEIKDVKGDTDSKDEACPWWWIILLVLAAATSLVSYRNYLKEEEPRYWYAWPALFGLVAFASHLYLHTEYKDLWYCDWFWVLDLAVLSIVIVAYKYFLERKNNKDDIKK